MNNKLEIIKVLWNKVTVTMSHYSLLTFLFVNNGLHLPSVSYCDTRWLSRSFVQSIKL